MHKYLDTTTGLLHDIKPLEKGYDVIRIIEILPELVKLISSLFSSVKVPVSIVDSYRKVYTLSLTWYISSKGSVYVAGGYRNKDGSWLFKPILAEDGKEKTAKKRLCAYLEEKGYIS